MVRTSWVRRVAAFAETYEALDGPFEARLPPESWARIQDAPRVSWLDFATYHDVIEAIRVGLGNEGLQTCFSAYMLELREVTLYKPLLRGIDLFGKGAESMLRLYARGYALAFKRTGVMTLTPHGETRGHIRVQLTDIPEPCRKLAYAHAHCGGVIGGFALAHARAQVTPDLSELGEGRMLFEAIEIPEEEPAAAEA